MGKSISRIGHAKRVKRYSRVFIKGMHGKITVVNNKI